MEKGHLLEEDNFSRVFRLVVARLPASALEPLFIAIGVASLPQASLACHK